MKKNFSFIFTLFLLLPGVSFGMETIWLQDIKLVEKEAGDDEIFRI